MVYSKRQPGGAVAVLAIRLGAAEVAGSAALELSAAELAAAAALPMDAGANAGAGAGSGSFEATDVWSGATGPTVTAVSPWRPVVSAHNSAFVVFRPV